MSLQKLLLSVSSVAGMVLASILQFSAPVGAVEISKVVSGPVVVRLCPQTCTAINDHGFRVGSAVGVFERRGGWARISHQLPPEKLANLGAEIPANPAYWIAESLLTGGPTAAATGQESDDNVATPTARPSPADVRVAKRAKQQKRKVTLPKFRPGTIVLAKANIQSTAKTEDKIEVSAAPAVGEAGGEATTKPAADRKTETKVAMIKAEPAAPSSDNKSNPVKEDTAQSQNGLKPVAPKSLSAAADDAAKPDTAGAGEQEVTKEQQADHQSASAPATNTPATATPAANTATEKAAQPTGEEAKVAMVDQAKQSNDAAPKQDQSPAKDQPSETGNPAKKPAAEPTFRSANVEPIKMTERPKKYIKALDDKRLKKLPGRKSKGFSLEEIIAIRHHALVLLENKECKGIARGGRSMGTRGQLYVVCSDDITFLRQFPLEEQSW